jgi:hypothetical protein
VGGQFAFSGLRKNQRRGVCVSAGMNDGKLINYVLAK